MKLDQARELACPDCGGVLAWGKIDSIVGDEVAEAALSCARCQKEFPLRRHVPRFVPENDYCDNFSLEWRAHAVTQLDSRNGTRSSHDRLYAETQWEAAGLAGQRVLECGSGSGRFTEVLLEAGAQVFSFDYSGAVDSNWENNGGNPRLLLAQGDIRKIPFHKGTFDKVICFGVLQHTPDVRQSFMSMVPYLKPGGELVVDVYPRRLREMLHWKYVLRCMTKRMDKKRLYEYVQKAVPWLLPISLSLGRIPLLGRKLVRLIPVNNPEMSCKGLSWQELRDWSILDTYDWLSPVYDQPQTLGTLREWYEQAGLEHLTFADTDVYVGRGTRPTA